MKILVVFTGGTIACSDSGGALAPRTERSGDLLEMYRKKDASVSFKTVTPYFILSEELSGARMENLYDCLTDNAFENYDGVIVTHGTDTLQFTAAFLGLKLGLCKTPVVLVSSNYPLGDGRSNGFENFCAAVELIRSEKGRGVFVSYRNNREAAMLFRGTSLLPFEPYSDRLTAFGGEFGMEICGSVKLNPEFEEYAFDDFSQSRLNGRVLWLRAHPGMIYPDLDGVKAVLLEGYHSGTLNTSSNELKEFCALAEEKNVGVYVCGSVKGVDYESKRAFEALKIKQLEPVSPVTAYIMLWLK